MLFIESSAQDIAVVFEACTALGVAARVQGDERTADQRRIDALTDVCRDILDTGRWNPRPAHTRPPPTGDTGDAANTGDTGGAGDTGNAGRRRSDRAEPGKATEAGAGKTGPRTGCRGGAGSAPIPNPPSPCSPMKMPVVGSRAAVQARTAPPNPPITAGLSTFPTPPNPADTLGSNRCPR